MPEWLPSIFVWINDDHIWLQTISIIITIIGLPLLGLQLRNSSIQEERIENTTKAQLLLELRAITHNYQNVHCNLRPHGLWSKSIYLPNTVEDWCLVETYMGVFEHVEGLIEKDLISIDEFRDLFQYRLHNLLSNPRIVKYKLMDEKDGWVRFLNLIKRLEIQLPPTQSNLPPFFAPVRD
ncbi:hypothetical protein FFK22_004085 [Mycobacterium sp. KBS0706]|uniref:hypothetical protein n=1 Tax=Mycobacterium sp. KBS0706 TaxID=2578109 RepID=UPI00110F8D12|nr:hypothetical protein [Mycobacterium sp. KBS0706]TSD89991.1 hypothetical protein FFK22_004085 [Mycobacterium sp. KBS0706]